MNETKKGIYFAIAGYTAWGFFPLFWKLLKHVNSSEIIAHRIIWGALFFSLILYLTKAYKRYQSAHSFKKNVFRLFFSASLITLNWLVYIWAVNHGHVLQSSLGYFLSPLMSVALGAIILKERLRKLQWFSVMMALIGVVQLELQAKVFPWVALLLASTFSVYGFARKKMGIEPLVASTIEAWLMVPVGIGYLIYLRSESPLAISYDLLTLFYLILGGLITALPLWWYTEAGHRLPFSTLGFFQYISPTLQFLCAITVFNEPFTRVHFVTFTCIWIALVVYIVDLRKNLSKS